MRDAPGPLCLLALLALCIPAARGNEGPDAAPMAVEQLGVPVRLGSLETPVSFSPGGERLAWGGPDGQVHVYDVQRRAEILTVPAHEGPVLALRYSLEGTRLASGGADGAKIWDAATGQLTVALEKDAGAVSGLELSPDATVLETFSNNAITLWDLASGKSLETGDSASVDGMVRIQPARGAAGYVPGWTTHSWDLATGKGYWGQGDRRDSTGFTCMSQDGLLLAKPKDGCFELWEAASGEWIGSLEGLGPDAVDMAFTPGGRVLGGIDGAGRITCVDLATGKVVWRSDLLRAVYLTFSRDGRWLAAGCSDGTAVLFRTGSLAQGQAPQAPEPMPMGLEEAWEEIRGADGVRAWRGVWALARAGDAAVKFLRPRLTPAKADEATVERLIDDLDSDDYTAREAAQAQLQRMRVEARPLLAKALESSPSAEQRFRLELLLAPLCPDPPLSPGDELTGLRGVAVLERIGTPEALALLTDLAGGPEETRLARDARAARTRVSLTQR